MIRALALVAALTAGACADKYEPEKRINPLSWISQHTGASWHPSRPYYGPGYYYAPPFYK